MKPSADSPQPIFAKPWAVRFGTALLVALTLVVALASFDATQRKQLESTSETTAVGDVTYFKPPAQLPAVAMPFKATNVVVSSLEEIDVRDTHVRRVAVDPASGLAIYELSAAASDEERSRVAAGGATFLLKIARNEFVGAKTEAP